jgi:hypothetical protein
MEYCKASVKENMPACPSLSFAGRFIHALAGLRCRAEADIWQKIGAFLRGSRIPIPNQWVADFCSFLKFAC